MNSKKIRLWLARALSFISVTLAVITLGWVGNLLQDNLQLVDVLRCPSFWGNLTLSIFLFVLFTGLAYRFGESLLPLRYLSKAHPPKPRKVLIIPLSPLNDSSPKAATTVAVRAALTKQPNLHAAIDHIKKLPALARWNGDNFLRALAAHEGELEKVVMIASYNVFDAVNGRDDYEAILQQFFPVVALHWQLTDFDDIDETYQLLVSEIEQAVCGGYTNKDIMLDCTGGIKATSIAAALATLHYKEVEVQYVQTNTREVLAYNMQSHRNT